jgi:hypothetical protein
MPFSRLADSGGWLAGKGIASPGFPGRCLQRDKATLAMLLGRWPLADAGESLETMLGPVEAESSVDFASPAGFQRVAPCSESVDQRNALGMTPLMVATMLCDAVAVQYVPCAGSKDGEGGWGKGRGWKRGRK